MSLPLVSRVLSCALVLALGPLAVAGNAVAGLLLVGSTTASDGLDNVDRLLLSPDDRFLFATALDDHSIASFERDATTGALTLRDVARDDLNGFDGLDSPGEPALDPSGRHLYIMSRTEDSLAVLLVGGAGQLDDFVELQKEGFAGVAGLDLPEVARVSPDGHFVYVGGTTAIAIFERDDATGGLDYVGQELLPADADEVLSMELSPDGSTLYVGTDNANLYAYARSAVTGFLALIDTETNGAGGVSDFPKVISLAASRDGRQLYGGTTSYIFVFARAPDGSLAFAQKQGNGWGNIARVALAPNGRGLWSSVFNVGGTIVGWRQGFHSRDPATGLLGPSELALFQGKDTGNGRIAASRDGHHLYVSDGFNNAIDVASVEPLAFVELQGDGIAGVDGLDGARSPAVSPDGRHVYAAGNADDAVAVFSRDTATGALAFVQQQRDGLPGVDGLDGAADVTISPDGKHVYVCGAIDDAVVVFSRNAATGALTFVEMQKDGVGAVTGLNTAFAAALSPDGKHLYVASVFDDTVTTFSRNATSGALTWVEEKRNGVGGVSGLDGAIDVAVSPDGDHVYVVSPVTDSIAIFTRNPTTGALGFVASLVDGPGSNLLDGADGVAVSRDGRHVYVVANTDDAISTFSRNQQTGALTLVEEITDATALVDGLDGAVDVALTADDRHVVVASTLAGAVVVFRRDPATGRLGYAQVLADVPGFAGLAAVGPSPDGRNVYVAGQMDDALVVFSPEVGTAAASVAACLALAALQLRRRPVIASPR